MLGLGTAHGTGVGTGVGDGLGTGEGDGLASGDGEGLGDGLGAGVAAGLGLGTGSLHSRGFRLQKSSTWSRKVAQPTITITTAINTARFIDAPSTES